MTPLRLHQHLRDPKGLQGVRGVDRDSMENTLRAQGVRVVFDGHAEWPHGLAPRRPDSPYFLYALGATIPKGPGLAVVGSRTREPCALRAARDIVRYWAQLHPDGSIVTGGGMGVDAAAMQAALDCDFPLIVVLASDVLHPRPRSLNPLFQALVSKGVLISENAPGLPCFPSLFPFRNRLIPLIAEQTVVVRAGLPSGSFHTLCHASRSGKPVWALTGKLGDPGYAGSVEGIRRGLANALLSLEDLGSAMPVISTTPDFTPMMNSEFGGILKSIAEGASSLNEIAESQGLTASATMRDMLALEMNGLVSRDLGGRYHLKSPSKRNPRGGKI